jgi:hypothetical protein
MLLLVLVQVMDEVEALALKLPLNRRRAREWRRL